MKKIPIEKAFSTSWSTALSFFAFLLPSFIALYAFQARYQSLKEIGREITILSSKAKYATEQTTRAEKLLKRLTNADPYYLEKSLESSCFLKNEIEKLEASGDEKRLSYLKGTENRLSFAELGLQRLEGFQEVEARQKHPVELDIQDLKELLKRIEGEEPQAPDLVIKQLELIRKPSIHQEEVFLLNLELLKREKIK